MNTVFIGFDKLGLSMALSEHALTARLSRMLLKNTPSRRSRLQALN